METILKKLLQYWEVTEPGEEQLSPVDCNQALLQAVLNLDSEIRQSGAIVTWRFAADRGSR